MRAGRNPTGDSPDRRTIAWDRFWAEVHRVLVPGGLHLWSVRSDAHPGRGEPETVPPNFPALGFVVPLRFFSREECDQRTGTRFERLAFVASEGSPTFYIADRKRRSP